MSYVRDVAWYWLLWVGLIVTVVADIVGYDWPGLTYPWVVVLALVAPFMAYLKLWGRLAAQDPVISLPALHRTRELEKGGGEAVYLLVETVSTSPTPIANCRVQIEEVVRVANGTRTEAGLALHIMMKVAGGASDRATLYPGTVQRWDLVCTRQETNQLQLSPWFADKWPNRLGATWFDPSGTYEFRLLATADNAPPARATVLVHWTNEWHNLQATTPSGPHT